MKRITIIGTGYVGLVTGISLARLGHRVTCLDIDQEKIDNLRSGTPPIYEPGLKEQLLFLIGNGSLCFSSSYREALSDVEICFFALPTPSSADGSCDLSYLFSAAAEMGRQIQGSCIVVNKSTVPVGTAHEMQKIIARATSHTFEVVSNPEFLKEGTALSDAMNPDRILLGVDSKWALEQMLDLYSPFADRIQVLDISSCELAKYAANAMLATRLSFMNLMSQLCSRVGANIDAVRRAIGADERIGPNYLLAGLGFGGSCLPKDVRALRATFEQQELSTAFFDSVLEINNHQLEAFVDQIRSHYGLLSGKTLAIWGLSFKPGTDDLRDAPSLKLIDKLLQEGASLRLYDPVAMNGAQILLGKSPLITFCSSPYEAAQGASGVVVATEWEEFKNLDFAKLGEAMVEKALFDGRNMFAPSCLIEEGFQYWDIGRSFSKEPALL